MKKKLLLVPLALLMIVSLVACTTPAPAPTTTAPAPTTTAPAPEKPTYKWKCAFALSPDHYANGLANEFAARVAELSSDRIQISVHPGAVLGDWIDVFEETMMGTIEIEWGTSYNTIHDPRLNVVWIPYAVTNWEEVMRTYSPGGFIWEKSDEMNRDLGVVTINSIPDGFIGMGASRLPASPGDPDVPKNMKIRVWGAIPPEKLMERFGYLPTVMPWSEVFTSMQQGLVEAVYGGSVIATYDTLRDVLTHWLPYRGNYEGLISIMNAELFDSLSAEDQGIIMKAAKEVQDKRAAAAEASEIEFTQKFRDYGVEVVEFSQAEYDNFRAVSAADVWPALEPVIGRALLDEAVAAIGGG